MPARTLGWVWFALVMLLAASSSTAAFAAPSTVAADLFLDGRDLVARGSVTSNGQPVTGGEVKGYLAGQELASTQTASDGSFTLRVPIPDGLGGEQPAKIEFLGLGDAEPAALEVVAALPEADDAAPADQSAQLEVNLGSQTVTPGGSLDISGSLLVGDNEVVADAPIDVLFNGNAVGEASTLTGEDGSFSTFLSVPTAASPGEATVTVTSSVPGLPPVSQETKIQIEPPAPVADPSESEEESEASAEPTPTESPTAAPTAEESPAATAANTRETSVWEWVLLGVVLVGGAVLFGFAIAWMRRRDATRRPHHEAESVFLDDDGRFGGEWEDGDSPRSGQKSGDQALAAPPARRESNGGDAPSPSHTRARLSEDPQSNAAGSRVSDQLDQPTGEFRPNFDQPTGEFQPNFDQPTGEFQPNFDQPTGEFQPNFDQPTEQSSNHLDAPTGQFSAGSEFEPPRAVGARFADDDSEPPRRAGTRFADEDSPPPSRARYADDDDPGPARAR